MKMDTVPQNIILWSRISQNISSATEGMWAHILSRVRSILVGCCVSHIRTIYVLYYCPVTLIRWEQQHRNWKPGYTLHEQCWILTFTLYVCVQHTEFNKFRGFEGKNKNWMNLYNSVHFTCPSKAYLSFSFATLSVTEAASPVQTVRGAQ